LLFGVYSIKKLYLSDIQSVEKQNILVKQLGESRKTANGKL